jgi:hypothetical protein
LELKSRLPASTLATPTGLSIPAENLSSLSTLQHAKFYLGGNAFRTSLCSITVQAAGGEQHPRSIGLGPESLNPLNQGFILEDYYVRLLIRWHGSQTGPIQGAVCVVNG